jgi:hypothetical protein
MSDIQSDLSAILADFAKSSISGEQAPAVAPETPVVTQAVETPQLEAPKVEPAVETAKPAEVVATTPNIPDEQSVFSDWDSAPATQVAATQASQPVEIFSELGKVLGLEKVESKEALVKALENYKLEVEKAKSGIDKAQIRPELLKAIELDQKGGDYKEFLGLSTVDYAKADPVELYEDYVIDRMADANGTVDTDKVNDFLDGLSDTDKKLRGLELQRQLINEQQRRVSEIELDATRKREESDTKLRSALGGLSEVDGFKVDDKHRREVFDWVSSGKIMRDLFYGSDGNLDPAKVAKIAFRNLYHERLDAYQKSKIRNTVKRELINDISNPQITSPAKPVNPTPKTGYDISDYITALEQGMGNK